MYKIKSLKKMKTKIKLIFLILQEIPLTSYFTLSYEKEELIVNKAYPSNRLFIFKGNQKTEMKIEGDSVDERNSTQNLSKTNDFLFITRTANIEKDNDTLIKREWYTGYIAIFNLILSNETK